MEGNAKARTANSNGRSGSKDVLKRIKPRKVDYKQFAKDRVEDVKDIARELGLNRRQTKELRKAFGAPISPEHRSSL